MGSYVVTPSVSGLEWWSGVAWSDDINFTFIAGSLTVNQAAAHIAITPYDVTYNGGSFMATGFANGAFDEDLSDMLDLSGTAPHPRR